MFQLHGAAGFPCSPTRCFCLVFLCSPEISYFLVKDVHCGLPRSAPGGVFGKRRCSVVCLISGKALSSRKSAKPWAGDTGSALERRDGACGLIPCTPALPHPAHGEGAARSGAAPPPQQLGMSFCESSGSGAGEELYKILHDQSSGTYFLSQCN